jgi:hypothetical protein
MATTPSFVEADSLEAEDDDDDDDSPISLVLVACWSLVIDVVAPPRMGISGAP